MPIQSLAEQKVRLSIVIPVYNAAATLAAAIEGALGQRFQEEFEIIAVDDGSTDSSADVLERYRGRVTIVKQANQGLSGARNSGVAAARGEYL
ncbi:MAG: glycosyltransferase, partial [Candidatus Binataceae bacterium]